MRVVYHLGVHHTDEDRLVRSLLKNRETLARQGIAVPGPGRYRKVLRDVVNRLRGDPAGAEAQEILLEAVSDIDRPDCIFFSNESFVCLPERALDEGRLYARAFKSKWLRQVFPDDPTVFAMGLRDPATFVPALLRARRGRQAIEDDVLADLDPRRLRWSEMAETILDANPDAEVIAWCNEDTPILWGAVMTAVTGAAPGTALEGCLDIALQIVGEDGAKALDEGIGSAPVADGPAFRQALAAVVEAHMRHDEVEVEVDLPGWDARLMEDLSAAYDEDIRRLAGMAGVKVLTP